MTLALDEKQYEEDLKSAYQRGRNDANFWTDTDYHFVYEWVRDYLPQQPDTSMHEMD